jgi:DnaJ-domain-containing protein 1
VPLVTHTLGTPSPRRPTTRRRPRAPLGVLLLLHAGMLLLLAIAHPLHRATAAAVAEELRNGEWRAALGAAADGVRRSIPRPPSPPPEVNERDEEAHACSVLGVSSSDEWGTIKSAYRTLVLKHHPDKLRSQLEREPTDEEVAEAQRRFGEVQEAHDVLERVHAARQGEGARPRE